MLNRCYIQLWTILQKCVRKNAILLCKQLLHYTYIKTVRRIVYAYICVLDLTWLFKSTTEIVPFCSYHYDLLWCSGSSTIFLLGKMNRAFKRLSQSSFVPKSVLNSIRFVKVYICLLNTTGSAELRDCLKSCNKENATELPQGYEAGRIVIQ